ncbi:von Willebrand factor type A domain protein [Rhodovulum sulfidophilum]|uniref:von Willebrand factor type A domain protein n=1 Tax=Rhodovulum sulfidophilum TaxID=35806 RepID=A0A0D6B0R5_RHOSU|nr:von Willebrand factor type A domain protein [Rhodovulum sulfidophilum]
MNLTITLAARRFFSGLLGDLADYFRAKLARGHAAFVDTASGFSDVAETMERKLPRELQGIAVGQVSPRPGTPPRHRFQ